MEEPAVNVLAAIEALEKAIHTRPDYAEARFRLASLDAAQNRLTEAEEQYRAIESEAMP